MSIFGKGHHFTFNIYVSLKTNNINKVIKYAKEMQNEQTHNTCFFVA